MPQRLCKTGSCVRVYSIAEDYQSIKRNPIPNKCMRTPGHDMWLNTIIAKEPALKTLKTDAKL